MAMDMGVGCMDGLSVSLDFLFASLVYWRTDSFGKRTRNDAFFSGISVIVYLYMAAALLVFASSRFIAFRFYLAGSLSERDESADNPVDAGIAVTLVESACIIDYCVVCLVCFDVSV